MKNLSSETLTTEIVGCLTALYPRLCSDDPLIRAALPEIPPVTEFTERLAKCSFMVFSDAGAYQGSERAKPCVTYPGPGLRPRDLEIYRVFFNDHSKKIYIDLNEVKWVEEKSPLPPEDLYCEILKTLLFALSCDIALPPADHAPTEEIVIAP